MLEQAAECTSSGASSFWFPLLALVVSAAAVIVGPILSRKNTQDQIRHAADALKVQGNVSLRIAKLDFRKSFVSTSRQAWINELRGLLSEFVGATDYCLMKISNELSSGVSAGTDSAPFFRELSVLKARIELLLNPKEDNHNNLMVRIDEMTDLFTPPISQSSFKAYATTKQDMLDRAKVILKEEWVRAKSAK